MKYFKSRLLIKNSKGFTIIELMIATAVFSITLIILAVSLISINHQYFKGISEGNTELAANNILNDVTSAVQFSDGSLVSQSEPNNSGYFCIGNTEFYYTLYSIDQPGQTNPLLEVNKCINGMPSSQNCPSQNCTISNLLGKNMQLINFSINQYQNSMKLFQVKISLAFGRNDQLFCSLVGTNCQAFQTTTQFVNALTANQKVFCLPNNPVDLCSIQNLSTYVSSRYNSNE